MHCEPLDAIKGTRHPVHKDNTYMEIFTVHTQYDIILAMTASVNSPTHFMYVLHYQSFVKVLVCYNHHNLIQLVKPEKGAGTFNTSTFSVRIMSSDMQRSLTGG